MWKIETVKEIIKDFNSTLFDMYWMEYKDDVDKVPQIKTNKPDEGYIHLRNTFNDKTYDVYVYEDNSSIIFNIQKYIVWSILHDDNIISDFDRIDILENAVEDLLGKY